MVVSMTYLRLKMAKIIQDLVLISQFLISLILVQGSLRMTNLFYWLLTVDALATDCAMCGFDSINDALEHNDH